MADGDKPPKFKASSSDDSDSEDRVKLDLLNLNCERRETAEHNVYAPGTSQNEVPARREENPFSFKHFLRDDKTNYHSQGARPKVYCEGRPINSLPDLDIHPSSESHQTNRIVPELSSALPDFVQDHLVIEQCYLGNPIQGNYNVDVNNLPDFTQRNRNTNDLPRRENNSAINIPLDLPVRPQAEFPLDLPITEPQSGSRSCPSVSEVGNSKSLPDFLADGAARTQNNDGINNSGQSPEYDTNRLRQEMELLRQQLQIQTRRADFLSRELELARNKEHEYTQNLAKALEQVEKNLERSNIRAASSENVIVKLRQEVKSLNNENNILRRENRLLRGDDGASGGPSMNLPNEIQSQRVAQELRTAATTAEQSLRQLLTGVGNLRMLASSLESMSRIEEHPESYHSDIDDDTGPAL
ncbi:PREDICTED: serologically defined colon cancer antigen 3 homolog [Nicrophorus vespilloides]|uniref:Endosome-associated-trafficking regulator 1 n=1 Tax=Nicrophorus vespilloides TaxID=110193 RepID=A0ABM1N0H9_NICVS|nr:PREDICTED: serologically defined colon cancer antigen 3 homolog [Nicrophorus vespilloides]